MILVCAILVVGCTATTKEELTESGLKRSDFQTEVDGEKDRPVCVEEQKQHGSLHH